MAQKTLKTRGTKTNYPSDVSDEEWEFCAPYFCLMKEDAPQRDYSLRGMFNAVCYIVCAGCPWRMTPNDLPPWSTVHHKRERWIKAGCCACSPRSPSTFGGDPLWTHSAKHSGEWRARGLRRLQATQGFQSACRRRHLGPLAGTEGHGCQRTRAGKSPTWSNRYRPSPLPA